MAAYIGGPNMLLHLFSYDENTGLGYASPSSCAFDHNKPVFQVLSKKRLQTNRTYSFKETFTWIGNLLIRHELDYENANLKGR